MGNAAAALAPGALVLGRYRPIRPLGSGGAGSVWLARDERSGRDVALKIVRREGTMGPRAEREASAAAQLRHEHCVRAYALARDAEHVYIAYEYVAGKTLREAMRGGELDDEAVLEAAAQILDGLAYAHEQGIVHRDVKPANVLLEDRPELCVRILDFGLALIHEEETLTAVGDIPGTLAYISPERLRGETAGPPADVWSVGVLLWEGLVGRHPFWNGPLLQTAKRIASGAPSIAAERPDLPKAVVALVDRALAVDPRKRPSARKLAGALRRVSLEPDQGVPRTFPVPRLPGLERAAPAAAAALFAGWTASALPFYPAHWAAAIALGVGALSLLGPRLGLLLALGAPVFPLGNLSFGLAVVYGVIATVWFAFSVGEPRSALLLVAGPLLAPAGGLGLLPLAGQLVRSPVRRAFQVAGAVLCAALVGSAGEIHLLGIDGSSQPLSVAGALWRTLQAHAGIGLEAVALAAVAVLLPYARGRTLWHVAGLGAAMLGLTLLAAPHASALPLVLAAWATSGLLAAEPFLRAKH